MPLSNFGIVDIRENGSKFYRCAQPDANGCSVLHRLGIDHIIRLNEDAELTPQMEQEAFGGTVDFLPIPTFSVNLDNVRTIVQAIHDFLSQGHSVAVHCAHGRDRTGLIVGAYRILFDGWTIDRVQEERKTYGVNFIIGLFDHEMDEALEKLAASRS